MGKLVEKKARLFDFYSEYKQKIGPAKKVATKVLLCLKFDKKTITFFSPLKERMCIKRMCLEMYSEISLCSEEVVSCIFSFNLKQQGFLSPEIKTGFKKIYITIPLCFSFDFEKTATSFVEAIGKIETGLKNEKLFLDFLNSLNEFFPERIRYAHYAGEHKDFKKGIDFIVGYVPHKREGELFEVRFQLKSSDYYIERHLLRYPGVHVFVFQDWMIKNRERLKLVFFSFLEEALSSPKDKAVVWKVKNPPS